MESHVCKLFLVDLKFYTRRLFSFSVFQPTLTIFWTLLSVRFYYYYYCRLGSDALLFLLKLFFFFLPFLSFIVQPHQWQQSC